MARTSRKDFLTQYKRQIDHARKWREQEGYDALWARMTDLYRGKVFDSVSVEDRIAVNVAFGTINVIYPSISVNYPKVTVLPNKPEFTIPAQTCEGMVNYYWGHHNFHKPFRRATKDFLIFGHGWLKVGWRYKERDQALSEDERANQFYEQVEEADAYAQANPAMAGSLPTDEEIAASLPEIQGIVVEDRPFVERVSPYDVYVDPEATCLEDAAWIAQRIVRPLKEAKADVKYSAAARNKLTSDHVAATQQERSRTRSTKHDDPEIERTTIWEFYNLLESTMSVCGDGAEDFLVAPRPMPYNFGHPFVMMGNYEVPDQFYPIGDLEALEPLQAELNKTRTQMMNARKHYSRKYLIRESAFGPEGRQALSSDIDNTLVPVADEMADLNGVIVPMPMQPLAAEIFNHSALIEEDISQVSGVSEYQRGQVPETRRTATEAAIISDAVNARAADKLAIIEGAISEIGRRVVQICQQFVTGDHVLRIRGEQDAVNWVKFDRDAIQGEFDFEVEGGSTQPMNETARRQQAVAMLNSLAPLIGAVIDPAKIAAHVLQHGFGIKNPADFMMAQPPMGMAPGQPGAPPMGPGQPPMGPEGQQGMGPSQGEPGLQPPPMGDPLSAGAGGAAPMSLPPELLAMLAAGGGGA